MPWLRTRRSRSDAVKALNVYYASDVHGSERCWRKFLGAATFYEADALIMGGDLTGKGIVPIEIDGDRFAASLLGERHTGSTNGDLSDFEAAVRYNGMYPWRASRTEIAQCSVDATAQAALFSRVMLADLSRWMMIAEDKLTDNDVPVFVIAGNDDEWDCDEVLAGSSRLTFCDRRITQLGPHELLSLSYANPTPWRTPREFTEDELYNELHHLAEQLERPQQAIFNLHVPPYASTLDNACEITDDLKPVFEAGQPKIIPVGSKAVREILMEYQPLLSLHGHIHESRGETRLGRTVAINSGSEYSSGRIHGALVAVTPSAVKTSQFVVG